MRQTLIRIVKREAFRPGPLGVLINPFYIIRKGLHQAIRRIAPTIQGRILDLGCGSKPYEQEFTNASEYVGVDLQVSGHKDHDSKVDIYYDGKTLPVESGTFDAVVSFEAFEHIFNLDEVLQEVSRVLKSRGTLFLTIPFVWDEHEVPYDFGRYTSFGIKFMLEKNGFDSIEIVKTTTYYQAVRQLGIAYMFQHVLPKNEVMKRIMQLIVIPPMTLWTIAINKVMPKSYDCYCNMAVVCRRSS